MESTHKNSVWPHKKVYWAHKNFLDTIFENFTFFGVQTHKKLEGTHKKLIKDTLNLNSKNL